jgi:phosphoenolpyruvate synthase/pyruvate phosphate dikinase
VAAAGEGVGLARMEFVVSNAIKVHPMALTRFDELRDEAAREEIAALTRGYADKPTTSSTTSRAGSRASRRSATPSRSSCG